MVLEPLRTVSLLRAVVAILPDALGAPIDNVGAMLILTGSVPVRLANCWWYCCCHNLFIFPVLYNLYFKA